eukprot:TRINITY_DN345_c0_g1_i1.p1 TRINITY_DN345_c0_g1~~TRINITY_DN345_c0_g1_i1.p1  ORF type:complete len:233 (+),score=37.56 TRINITY_DN345_c0_g1_i1:574-1272(+)
MSHAPQAMEMSTQGGGGGGSMERLMHQNSLLVKQRRRGWWQECLGCEYENEYKIYDNANNAGQEPIYIARENSSCCCRTWCANAREFTMDVRSTQDESGVVHFDAPFRCCCRDLTVSQTGGDGFASVTGEVFQRCSWCVPELEVVSQNRVTHQITGECCPCTNQTFTVRPTAGSAGGGTIKKNWSGFKREFLTDADFFTLEYPNNSDPEERANLLGALFLIDFLYYERGSDQ